MKLDCFLIFPVFECFFYAQGGALNVKNLVVKVLFKDI